MMYTAFHSPRYVASRPEFAFTDPFFRAFFDVPMMPHRPAPVRVHEEKDEFVLEAALPGVPQERIELSVEKDMLKLIVDFRPEKKEEENVRHGHAMGRMEREFDLDGIDQEHISASYKDGMLRVVLPKEKPADEKPARRIAIMGESQPQELLGAAEQA